LKKLAKKLVVLTMAVSMLATSVMGVSAATVEDFFDAEYYAEQYPDLAAAFGNNEELLYQHYLQYGINEGRNASNAFDVRLYKEMYKDLDVAFGDNWAAYLNHYLAYGINEARDGGGEFDIVAYMQNNPDVVATLGTDFATLKNHYDTVGKAEGRVVVSEAQQDKRDAAQGITHSSSKSSSSSSSSSSSRTDLPTLPTPDMEELMYNLTKAFCTILDAWVDYQDDCEFESDMTIRQYNTTYSFYLSLKDALYQFGDTETIAAWEAYADELMTEAGVTEEDNFYYINGYIEIDGVYYDQIGYQDAYEYWLSWNPQLRFDSYLESTNYDVAYENWVASEPQLDDYTIGYATEEAATEAYEADLEAWEDGKPVQSDFYNEDEYNAAMDAYIAENPEPDVKDYTYYEDGFSSEEAAQTAYDNAHEAWAESEPVQSNFINEEAYNEAVAEWEALEPQESAYVYYDDGYVSEEAAQAAYETAHTAWEGEKATALDGLEEETDEYNTALETFLASNPEPAVETYLEKVNEFTDAENAAESYATDHAAWEANEPAESDYEDEDAYNEAVAEWEASEPQVEDYTGKVNNFNDAATAESAFNYAYAQWELDAPKTSDYENEEAFNEAMEAYIASNPEPVEEDYVTGDYETAEEAENAYAEDHEEWEEAEPNPDALVSEQTTYDADVTEWEETEPELEDYPVTEEEMTDEVRDTYNQYLG